MGIRSLLDASLPNDILDQIQELILADSAVSAVQWISGRNAGRVRFVEAGVVLRINNPEKISIIPQRIEAQIREKIPHVERVLIHPETAKYNHILYAIPVDDTFGTLSHHFSQAPFFVFINHNLEEPSYQGQQLVENPYKASEKSRGIQVAEWLVEQKVDIVVLPRDFQGKEPSYVLKDAGVREQKVQATTIMEALEEINDERAKNQGEAIKPRT